MTTATSTRRQGLMQAARWTAHGIRFGLAEIWWWLSGPFRFLWRAPGKAVVWMAGTVAAYVTETWLLLTALGLVAVVAGVWARGWPDSYLRHVTHPGWRRRIRRSVRRSWGGLMEACGLSRRVIGKDGPELRVPVLHRIGWQDPDVLVVVPQLMVGQTVEDIVSASDRLRVAVGSRQVRVIPNSTHTGCTVRFLFADPLAAVLDARFPSPNLTPTRSPRRRWG